MVRVAVVVLMIGVGACGGSGDRAAGCIQGMSVACACPGGGDGAQLCLADGTFGVCDCEGPSAVDAAPTADGPPGRTCTYELLPEVQFVMPPTAWGMTGSGAMPSIACVGTGSCVDHDPTYCPDATGCKVECGTDECQLQGHPRTIIRTIGTGDLHALDLEIMGSSFFVEFNTATVDITPSIHLGPTDATAIHDIGVIQIGQVATIPAGAIGVFRVEVTARDVVNDWLTTPTDDVRTAFLGFAPIVAPGQTIPVGTSFAGHLQLEGCYIPAVP